MNFAHPGWLVLLILLPLLGIGAVLTSRLQRRQWTAFMAPRLRDALLKRGSSLSRWLALFFLLAACAALIIALARPRGDAGTKMEKTLGRNVMVALDISKSMRASDVKPDRLTQAKVVIYELLEAMPNERIGFIGFAGTAYVYAPLTIDHSAVRETIEQIDETWAPLGGSDLAAAVELATETLKKTGQKNNALVILSDGEENDGQVNSMIAAAEQAGVYIITIGVGTEDGGHVPNPGSPSGQMVDRSGRPVISRLQTDALRKLAEETKGRFAIAGSGLDIPALVKSVVKDLDAFEMEGRERRISIEFYQWLVFPAIVLLMASIFAGTRWKGVRAALLTAGAFLTISNTDANEATIARDSLAAKRYPQAREAYHKLAAESKSRETQARYRLGEATAAYRGGEFREARGAFSQALLSDDSKVRANGHLGLGNSLFQLGWKGLADEAYPADPATLPDIGQFDALVKKALAKLRESEAAEDTDTGNFVMIESLITNWADAVRHYNSALSLSTADPVARQNREMTMTYLKRLEELLKEEKQAAEQAMPQPEPGEGQPGDGDCDKEGGNGKPKKSGEPGNGNKDPKDGKGEEGDKDKDQDGKNGKKPDKDKKDGEKKDGGDPNESPQERAHRILKENADPEKGPITPGRREFRNAEKDW
jgi:Ca-activated chloride channel family protein